MEFESVVFYGRLGEQALRMFGLADELPRWRGLSVLSGYDQGQVGCTDALHLERHEP